MSTDHSQCQDDQRVQPAGGMRHKIRSIVKFDTGKVAFGSATSVSDQLRTQRRCCGHCTAHMPSESTSLLITDRTTTHVRPENSCTSRMSRLINGRDRAQTCSFVKPKSGNSSHIHRELSPGWALNMELRSRAGYQVGSEGLDHENPRAGQHVKGSPGSGRSRWTCGRRSGRRWPGWPLPGPAPG